MVEPLFGRHVRDGRPIRNSQVRHAGTEEFDKPVDDADLSKLFGDVKHEVSCGRALGEFSSKADADDFGKLHRDGLAEHRGFGLNTPDPQPTTPMPPIIGVWLSVPTRVSGRSHCSPSRSRAWTTCPRYSRFTW